MPLEYFWLAHIVESILIFCDMKHENELVVLTRLASKLQCIGRLPWHIYTDH